MADPSRTVQPSAGTSAERRSLRRFLRDYGIYGLPLVLLVYLAL